MKLFSSGVWARTVLVLVVQIWNSADCYDPMDPNGNITVTFDIHGWTLDGYTARVTIQNYYQYRHVEKPGWNLGWTWAQQEVIMSIAGALATQQGNCSNFKFQIPHSCKRDPVIVDLMPDAPPENRSANCCLGGLLAAWAVDPPKSVSSFELVVGNLETNKKGNVPDVHIPRNPTLMAPGPGYTCGPLEDYSPTIVPVVGGRREEQVFRTWKSACTYSTFLANKAPVCCVSLSAFYNPTITPCPACSCGCESSDSTTHLCARWTDSTSSPENIVSDKIGRCTDHMCPVQIHWHIKSNYRDQWRVKLTVSNYNYGTNYSDWNVLVQHPTFRQSTRTYSFNATKLPTIGDADEVAALFWGLENYNEELLQAGGKEPGSVTSELLMTKDAELFTLSNGWAFPRRVYFNGDNCEMPMPDSFPGLPSAAAGVHPRCLLFLLLLPLLLLFHWER